MAAHAIRVEIRSLSRALATQYVCIGSTDLVLRRLFASLIVPFIGHAAIVTDMDIPVGRQSHWPISRIPITFREECSKLLRSLSPITSYGVGCKLAEAGVAEQPVLRSGTSKVSPVACRLSPVARCRDRSVAATRRI